MGRSSAHTNLPRRTLQTPGPADDKLWLAMEFCGGGSVTDLAKNMLPKRLPETMFQYVLHETLKALVYLHSQGIVHRDIKGQNILMTDDGDIRLSAFFFRRRACSLSHE